MTITYGPNLGLLENAATGEAHDAALRGLLRGIDGLVQGNVKGYLTNTPPASPANGDCYIIGAAPTGAWAGHGGQVARYSTIASTWEFYVPKNGWMLQSNTAREIYRYTASAWEIYYQEGTWTITIAGGTTPGVHSYSLQYGAYRKIGGFCWVTGRASLSSKDATMSGPITLQGLPFTVVGTGGYSVHPASIWAWNMATSISALQGGLTSGQTYIPLYKNAYNTGLVQLDSADIGNTTSMLINLCISI